MWRIRGGSFAVAWALASVVACGGRAQIDGSGDAPSVTAGTSGAAGSGADTSADGSTPTTGGAGAAGAGGAGGAGAAEADSDLSNSCPQTPSNRACPTAEIDIRFTRDAVGPRTGVWVEPLQIPDYTNELPADRPEVEPSNWDRSPLPAGACVLRIHGLPGSCLQLAPLYVGTCASLADPDSPHVIPVAYYEKDSCRQGIAPGCPSAAASDWRNGNWWYLVARGEDTDLVVCAPECGTTFNSGKHACLRVAGSG
ncbi:MAG: hypothetical protein WDO69_09885 [Pseudomonadota bacterium]